MPHRRVLVHSSAASLRLDFMLSFGAFIGELQQCTPVHIELNFFVFSQPEFLHFISWTGSIYTTIHLRMKCMHQMLKFVRRFLIVLYFLLVYMFNKQFCMRTTFGLECVICAIHGPASDYIGQSNLGVPSISLLFLSLRYSKESSIWPFELDDKNLQKSNVPLT